MGDLKLTNNWFLALNRSDNTDSANKVMRHLSKPIVLPFVATVSLTHIGASSGEKDLWAYAQDTPALTSINELLISRLGEAGIQCEGVTARINLGRLNRDISVRLPDLSLVTSFQIEGLKIIQEDISKDGVRYVDLETVLL